jgi:nucleotide-binding universal stress UspA family protein
MGGTGGAPAAGGTAGGARLPRRELGAPFYFPSRHALPASTIGAAAEPPQQELTANLQDRTRIEEAYRSQADQLLDALLEEVDQTVGGVQVQRMVVDDRHPAEALVALSADADLLVVGSRAWGLHRAPAGVGEPRRGAAPKLPGGRGPLAARRAWTKAATSIRKLSAGRATTPTATWATAGA